ncbi:TRAPP trafficking subunit Trs65-domain-containing protein [Nemania sp. FL0916]|nr:TRAPP trafficking subunit Trs65-domain-containing protein [Nemania sp. FL0916]
MGDESSYATSGPDPDFVDKSSLKYIIPQATDFALDGILGDGSIPFAQALDSIEQRESLFFDESVDVVLVLTIPHAGDDALQAALNGLVISIDAQIVNGNIPDHDSSPASEVIYTGTIDGSKDPAVLVHSPPDPGPGPGPDHDHDHDASNGAEPEGYTYALWKKSVSLTRPRFRLQSASAVFVATASSRSAAGPPSDQRQAGYMPSGVASGLNLLESFGGDPALGGITPRLSALRVSRVAPLTQQAHDFTHPINSLSRLSLRIYPAIHSRIRFTRPNSAPPTAALIAMLEVDFTPFFDCEIVLNGISLAIPDAAVEDLTEQAGISLPLSCVSHDHITFVYRIAPTDTDVVSKGLMRDLNIEISATALVDSHTKPQLRMAWTAAVDLTVPVTPGYSSTMLSTQRTHRPAQLSIGGDNTTSLTAPSIARPDALPSLEASTTQPETTAHELGITVTFSAPSPPRKIFVGDEFCWNVLVVNQSLNQTTAARKLAMVVVPRRRRNESRVTRPPSLSRAPDGTPAHSKLHRVGDVAEATLDDTTIHAMQSSSVVDITELICLNSDIRVGPLTPSTCHAAELRFLALKEGLVGIDALRVIDLGSNEHVDIRQLPTVIVESK